MAAQSLLLVRRVLLQVVTAPAFIPNYPSVPILVPAWTPQWWKAEPRVTLLRLQKLFEIQQPKWLAVWPTESLQSRRGVWLPNILLS